VDEFDENGNNSIELSEFLRIFKEHDFSSNEWSGLDHLGDGVYEVMFEKPSLGILILTTKVESPANEDGGAVSFSKQITVVKVMDEDLLSAGHIVPGDVILAVNGAPLNAVGKHTQLKDALAGLGRPVRITLKKSAPRMDKEQENLEADQLGVKANPDEEGMSENEVVSSSSKYGGKDSADRDESVKLPLSGKSGSRPMLSGFTEKQLKEAFRKYDRDGSNSLDTFELGDALASLVGRPIPTAEMVMSNQQMDSIGDCRVMEDNTKGPCTLSDSKYSHCNMHTFS
jgi:hypothetical protein